MGDWAVSEIRLDTSIQLPYPTRFASTTLTNSLSAYTAAKNFAVGFASNNQSQYSNTTKKVQDNSYYYSFAQSAGNKNIWIPPLSMLRENRLIVMGQAESTSKSFTFGDLMSLYGDYRRTTRCSNGNCFLTPANTNTVSFAQGWDCYFKVGGGPAPDATSALLANCGYRPNSVSTTAHLRRIAAGVWPPYGNLGNTLGNTALEDDDYFEGGWWGDEMMRIANTNDWHFSNGAVAWYIGMHRLALYYVDLARTDPQYWNHALHYEASALHSLSDLFAFGHVVTSRDETSYGVMVDKNLSATTTYQWMENVLNMGSGERTASGRISLTSSLPPIADSNHNRNDFLASYLGVWANWGRVEHDYHDQFNNGGALVRNLRGDSFFIYGDAKLRNMSTEAKETLKEAIRTSVRSLFDAYVKLNRYGDTIAAIGEEGSDYFIALRYIPVFVESDPGNFFKGRWTRYAQAIDTITGTNRVPAGWPNCQMPYINGGESLPTSSASACTSFPEVTANNEPSESQLLAPTDGETNIAQSTEFRWTQSIDPDGDTVKYDLLVCDDPAFPESCSISLVLPDQTLASAASGVGLSLGLFATTLVGSAKRRRRIMLHLCLILLVALPLASCGSGGGSETSTDVSHTVTNLNPATNYYWKVIAYDGDQSVTESGVSTFTTQ